MCYPAEVPTRADYRRFLDVPTRWMDNDVYGHVNNVVYYSFFDTAVNRALIDAGVLDIHAGPTLGLVVESSCTYTRALAFPDLVRAGIAVRRLGTSSVRYAVGLFRGDDEETSAHGRFVHVYVDRQTRRPCPLSPELRAALAPLVVEEPEG